MNELHRLSLDEIRLIKQFRSLTPENQGLIELLLQEAASRPIYHADNVVPILTAAHA